MRKTVKKSTPLNRRLYTTIPPSANDTDSSMAVLIIKRVWSFPTLRRASTSFKRLIINRFMQDSRHPSSSVSEVAESHEL